MGNLQKKVVILLVEGDTDETLLIERLRQLFVNHEIRFEPYNGDIFYEIEQQSKPIKNLIGERVKEILTKRRFKPSDILAVLHILDTDGCFIDSSKVRIDVEQKSLTKYLEENISVKSEKQKQNIEKRNEVRSKNIKIMHATSKISTFTYRLFYFSRNLEHVIFNDLNPERESKLDNVEDFLDELDIPLEHYLVQFLPVNQNEDFEDPYTFSWQYISEEINSLKRATNTPLMFDFLGEMSER